VGRLKSKVALITGGTQGVGEGIALVFAKEGAGVAINGRSAGKGVRALEKLRAVTDEARFFRADVSIKHEAQELVSRTVEAFGRIDVLVNNAMVIDGWKRAEDDSIDAALERSLRSCVYASLWLSQAAFPYMRDQGGGCIINFGSTGAIFGNSYQTHYSTAKEAIHGLTRTLAQEWGRHNVTVNTLMPAATTAGIIRMQEAYAEHSRLEEFHEQALNFERTRNLHPLMVPRAEIGVAPAAVGLASDSGQFITGQTIFVDGGIHLWGPNQHAMLPGVEYQLSSQTG